MEEHKQYPREDLNLIIDLRRVEAAPTARMFVRIDRFTTRATRTVAREGLEPSRPVGTAF
jgi:hypothetical protein